MQNTKKRIGIVGGAGPMASSVLLEYLILEFQKNYNCKDDADFPQITLMSIPFAQMLQPGINNHDTLVAQQLKQTLESLHEHSDFIGIACNTLHGFLPKSPPAKLIDLIAITKDFIKRKALKHPLILGTSTSAQKQVHTFPGQIHPNAHNQKKLDEIIDAILSGDTSQQRAEECTMIITESYKSNPLIDSIVLGCTEFSVLAAKTKMHYQNLHIVDPLHILTHTLCQKSVS